MSYCLQFKRIFFSIYIVMTVFFSLVYCSSVELMEMLNDKNMLNAIHTIEKKHPFRSAQQMEQ